MVKSFETKIHLSTIVDEKVVKDVFITGYNINPDTFYLSKIVEQNSARNFIHKIPVLFNKIGMNHALKGHSDSYTKMPPKELFVVYDIDRKKGKKDLLWILAADSSLVIRPEELPKDAKIRYDTYGNLKMKLEDITVRITLKPDYKEINKKYEGMLHL